MKKAFLYVIYLALISNVLFAQGKKTPTPDQPVNVPIIPVNATAGKNQSELVFQISNPPPGVITHITIDGKIMGQMNTNGIGKLIVPNGNHIISVCEIPITINARSKRYNFLITWVKRGLMSHPQFTLANESELTTSANGIEDALDKASQTIITDLPNKSVIAVLSISSRDRENAAFVVEELEYILVDTGFFKIVDRKSLDKIREEQNFQMSGDVDVDSAVSIGKMLGANIVITGSISGTDSTRRLRIKALDVKTAEILTMASEKF